jgi:hypothetical protein
MYFELRLKIQDQKCVKKAKCFYVYNHVIQKSNMFVQQSALCVL